MLSWQRKHSDTSWRKKIDSVRGTQATIIKDPLEVGGQMRQQNTN